MELREKKEKRCANHEREKAGDQWDHTAVAADSKLVVSLVVGKRTYQHTLAVVQDAKDRLRHGYLPAIFTDAFAGYESALLEVFGRRYPAKGRGRREVIRWRQGLAYGQVKKCYKGGRVDRVAVRAVHGKARLAHVLSLLGYTQINTRVVERHNGTSRLRNQRKVRKTLAFSKAPRYHCWMRGLSVGLYNFCRPHSSLQITQDSQVTHCSPAMAAGLTDHLWSTREWLLTPVFERRG
jgi:IS1 family transposase